MLKNKNKILANYCLRKIIIKSVHVTLLAVPEGVGFGSPTPGRSQTIGFLKNTAPDPWKVTKLLNRHSMLGHQRHASNNLNSLLLAGL